MSTISTFQAQYDGRVLIPQEPVDLEPGQRVRLQITRAKEEPFPDTPLGRIARCASKFKGDPNAPHDSAIEHDHYLYKTDKRY